MKPELTAERLRELLHYDPETGVFTNRVTRSNNAKEGCEAGCPSNGYLVIFIEGRLFRAHRLAWLYVTGSFPTHMVDHINRDGADNRWENLRAATPLENQRNRKVRKDCATGKIGVRGKRGKWQARIRLQGVDTYLGTFDTMEVAVAARRAAELQHFGEFATA
jgi:hypothetical protein